MVLIVYKLVWIISSIVLADASHVWSLLACHMAITAALLTVVALSSPFAADFDVFVSLTLDLELSVCLSRG
jgi:hypothetical protein